MTHWQGKHEARNRGKYFDEKERNLVRNGICPLCSTKFRTMHHFFANLDGGHRIWYHLHARKYTKTPSLNLPVLSRDEKATVDERMKNLYNDYIPSPYFNKEDLLY
jgi:hypothetical protein